MEKGLERQTSTSSSSSSDSDSDSDLQANVDDPWAIVEMTDDSEKWEGSFLKLSFLNSVN